MAAAEPLEIDDAIAFSDAELVERLNDRLSDIEDDDLYGDLNLFVDELTERHAPQIARLSTELTSESEYLEENLEALREREGGRLIRQAFDGE